MNFMRTNEFTGIYHMHEELSPEAFKAQRMAELEQIAKYRAARLKQFQEWADPVKRAERQQQAAWELRDAHISTEGKTVYLKPLRDLNDIMGISPLAKPKPKRSWLARLFGRK